MNSLLLIHTLAHSTLDVSNEESSEAVSPDIRPPLMPNLCQVRFAGRSLGSINSYSGIPVFSPRGLQWLQSRTGETATSEKLCSLGLPWLNANQGSRESLHLSSWSCQQGRQHTLDLPDREIVREYAESYNSSGLSLLFPLIEMSLFEETIRIAYDSPHTPYSPYVQCAKACIFSFLAFASNANIQSSALSEINIDECALEAFRLIPHIVEGPPSIDGLRTIILLVRLLIYLHLIIIGQLELTRNFLLVDIQNAFWGFQDS